MMIARFVDAHGKTWQFEGLYESFTLTPTYQGLRCDVLAIEPAESGQDIYTVSTAVPSGVSDRESYRTVFEVIRKRLVWTGRRPHDEEDWADEECGGYDLEEDEAGEWVRPMYTQTLNGRLSSWSDMDAAQHALALCIGAIPPDMELSETKRIFWTRNPVGNALFSVLRDLAQAGIMEADPDDDTVFRWNPFFKRSWSWKCEEQG